MEEPEPSVEGRLLKVDDIPLDRIIDLADQSPFDPEALDHGTGDDDEARVSAFNNYI
jgi:hypothetical protein